MKTTHDSVSKQKPNWLVRANNRHEVRKYVIFESHTRKKETQTSIEGREKNIKDHFDRTRYQTTFLLR